jgi:hypothetical protein
LAVISNSFQDDDLRRPIQDNQILGNEQINEEEEEEDEDGGANVDPDRVQRLQNLLEAAQERGQEKRIFIMNHLVPE